MIDKISKEFEEYLKDKYDGYIEKCNNGKLNIYIFGGCYVCNEIYNFKKSLKRYENIVKTCNIYEEQIVNMLLKNNMIWMTIETKEGIQRDTTIGGYNRMIKSRITFVETVKNNGHELLTTYIDAKEKVLIDFKCGHEPNYLTPNSYLAGTRCPICSNKIIKPYINDCYTLRPDLLKYFVNQEDAIGISVSDKKQRDFICPNCGTVRKNTIGNIACFGFSCPACSDGISYPNKFMYNILSSLNIEFEKEKHFDWCVYVDENGGLNNGYYDFFIPSKNLIIEMDGALHYKDGFNKNYSAVKMKDKQKDQMAIKYGYDIIRIDCNYRSGDDKFNYVKNSILTSLDGIFDFSCVNWEMENEMTLTSLKILAINMWNSDNLIGTVDIAKSLNMTTNGIINYLHQGHTEGLCDFSSEEQYRRKQDRAHNKFNKYIKVLKDTKIIGVFFDYYKFVDNFNSFYGEEIIKSKQSVMSVVDHKIKAYKGFVFEEIDKTEYDALIQNNQYITDTIKGVA